MDIIAKWTNSNLILRILCALVIGIALALLFPNAHWIGLFGTVFVQSLKAIAPVLVALLVTASIAKAKEGQGKRFRSIIVAYLATTLLAACISVIASYLFPVTLHLQDAAESSAPSDLGSVFENFLTSVVGNPIMAIAEANYLGVLFWSVVLGLALKQLGTQKVIGAISDIADACSKLVSWIIQFAPFGIMGLVFSSIADNGLSVFADYGRLLTLLIGCMLFTALVMNPLIVAFIIKGNPYPLVFKCLKESGISAFFTRSSAANIPVNMELCKKMGLDESFYSVSIPLGSTINMNGAAVTITVMTLAVCNTLGIDVGIGAAFILAVVATLAACGSSGVAGGSLLLIPMSCALVGVDVDIAMQAVGVGFIIGVIQDSVETALNSSGDAIFTAAVLIGENKKKKIK